MARWSPTSGRSGDPLRSAEVAMTTDSVGENVRSKNIPHQELVRNVDTDTTLELDPWRPLHEACDRFCIQKPKSDLEMQQVGKLWNGRHDVEHGCLDTLPRISNSSAIFPGLVRLDVSGRD